jgi:UbiD family decarboxylase
MPEQSIRPQLAALEAAGRLARVRRAVDPASDLAAVALKAKQQRGQGVLFENAGGMAAAAQILADREQWASALGVPAAGLLTHVTMSLGGGIAPVMVADAAWRTNAALAALPLPHAGADDDAAQTVAVAIAVDPDDGRACLGLTRLVRLDAGRLGIVDWCPTLERLRSRNGALPMALVLGGDPALYLAAALGTWRDADLALAGALAGAPIRLALANGLALPAEVEIAIVGKISPGETAPALRLATTFGTAAASTPAVFAVDAARRREDAIFPALHVGAPGDLAGTLALAAEALVAAHIRNIEGGIDVLDVRCPAAAAAMVVVKLRGRMGGQAKTALMGALSGPVNWFKFAVAVDEDVDAGDLRDVFWSMASRTHAEHDVAMIDGMRAHRWDPAAVDGTQTRWLVDSTMPPLTQLKRREDFARAVPKNLAATDLEHYLPKG